MPAPSRPATRSTRPPVPWPPTPFNLVTLATLVNLITHPGPTHPGHPPWPPTLATHPADSHVGRPVHREGLRVAEGGTAAGSPHLSQHALCRTREGARRCWGGKRWTLLGGGGLGDKRGCPLAGMPAGKHHVHSLFSRSQHQHKNNKRCSLPNVTVLHSPPLSFSSFAHTYLIHAPCTHRIRLHLMHAPAGPAGTAACRPVW